MLALIARFVWWYICRKELVLTLESHTIWRDGAPYMTRMFLFGRDGECSAAGWRGRVPFNVFVHCIMNSDGAEYHSHPYRWAWALILRGSYKEIRWRGGKSERWLGPGELNVIDRDTFHRIELPANGLPTWTLFVAPRPRYIWWFYDAVTGSLRKASGKKKGAGAT